MPFYQSIKEYQDSDEIKWIATRLLDLRSDLYSKIGEDKKPEAIILGSWNIRAFDGGRSRRNESFHYIAEIISNFDICAIQEIKPNLEPLRRLMRLLGPNWDYFVTDVTDGDAGNNERMAFLYNTNIIRFRNLIGELVIDDSPIARTPFFASFQAGWFKFTLCNAHITFKSNDEREREIDAISEALKKRSIKEDEMYVFLGDMNIDSIDDTTMKALQNNGFSVPLFGPTNLGGNKHYDQIAFTGEGINTNLVRYGSFDWRNTVFKTDDLDHYKPIAEVMRGKPYADWSNEYSGWTTHEMSDHLPIWVEVRTDYSDEYLNSNYLA